MTRLDDATLATLLLTSRLVAEGPPPLKAREFWGLVDQVGGDPAALLTDVPAGAADPARCRACSTAPPRSPSPSRTSSARA